MNLSCPVCDGTKLELTKGEKELTVRNQSIIVDMQYYRCSDCGEEFLIPDSENDPFERAYCLYRARHNMLQPEEIRDFRHKYGLSQSDLANILGLGGATISRYETGKLQDETHDTLLRLVMDPENLRTLVANSAGAISEDRKNRILNAIKQSAQPKVTSLERFVTLNFGDYEPDEYSGFKKFDRDKFLNAVLYFCKGGEIKTKLNKLLFYADFQHFKEYTISITGSHYAHVPFGPAPNDFDLYYPILVRQNAIEVQEMHYQRFTGENFITKQEPNLNIFSESELRILALVKEHFKGYNANAISKHSHQEKGYQDTQTGDPISYAYAQYLQLLRLPNLPVRQQKGGTLVAKPHDRAAKLVARKLHGRYSPATSPDVKGKRGRAEVKSTADEVPKALRQLSGSSAPAFVVLPKSQHKQALKRLSRRKTGLMDYNGNVAKPSTRK